MNYRHTVKFKSGDSQVYRFHNKKESEAAIKRGDPFNVIDYVQVESCLGIQKYKNNCGKFEEDK